MYRPQMVFLISSGVNFFFFLCGLKCLCNLDKILSGLNFNSSTCNGLLRKLLTKGTNYREPRSINLSKAYFETDQALESCIVTTVTINKATNSFAFICIHLLSFICTCIIKSQHIILNIFSI